MQNIILKAISGYDYRTIDANGLKITFSAKNRHAILIGSNGSGKSNFLKSLYLKTRTIDDNPLGQDTMSDPKVIIEFSYGGYIIQKVTNPTNGHYFLSLPSSLVGNLILDVEDKSLDILNGWVEALKIAKPNHRIAGMQNTSAKLDSIINVANQIKVENIDNFNKWKSSLFLTNGKLANPNDAFTKYIVRSLNATNLQHLRNLVSNTKLTPAQKSNLIEQINDSLKELSKPINGLDLQVDPSLTLNGGKIEFITKQQNRALPLDLRSDGEVMLVSFLLFLEEHKLANSDVPQIFLFDELEASLDPSNQMLISELIAKVSENLHFIFSTHSPYMFSKKSIQNASSIYLVKKYSHLTSIEKIDYADSCKLNYPSWSEMNFVAYEIDSIEYHVELYSQIVADKGGLKQADLYLHGAGGKLRQYTKLHANQVQSIHCIHENTCAPHNVGTRYNKTCITLPTYIRHKIHHPENTQNRNFTPKQLHNSIVFLRNSI